MDEHAILTTKESSNRSWRQAGQTEYHRRPLAATARLGEFVWVLAGQVATGAATLVGVRMLTSCLPPTMFGEYTLALTGSILAQQVLFAPLAGAVQRFFASALEIAQWSAFLVAVRSVLGWCVFAVTASASLLACGLWCVGANVWVGLLCATALFTLLVGVASLLDAIHAALRRRRDVACHQALTQWLRWSLATGAACWWAPTAPAAMWGAVLAVAISITVRLCTFYRVCRGWERAVHGTCREWQIRLRDYSWPFVVWGTFTWLGTASDRWALAHWASVADVGQYAAFYQLGYFPCVMLGDALQQLLAPIFFQQVGLGEDMARRRYAMSWLFGKLAWVTMVFVAVVTVAWLWCGQISRWLIAQPYHGHPEWLAGLVFAGSCYSIGQILALGIMGTAGASVLLMPKVVCALGTVGANFLAAWWAGISGVVVAMSITSAAYSAWCAVVYYRIHRTLHDEFSTKGPIDRKLRLGTEQKRAA